MSLHTGVIGGVEGAFHADHQAADLGIKTAQGGGGFDDKTDLGVLGQNCGLQVFCLLQTEAVGNADQLAVFQAPLFHHFHQGLDGLLVASGLVDGNNLTILRVTHGPDALRYFAQTYVLPAETQRKQELDDEESGGQDYMSVMCGGKVTGSYLYA